MYDYLNTDTNRELSKLLTEKGCVSESGLFHCDMTHYLGSYQKDVLNQDAIRVAELQDWSITEVSPAYSFEDCIRRENAVKIWGDYKVCESCGSGAPYATGLTYTECCNKWTSSEGIPNWQYKSNYILKMYQSGGDWQTYILNHLKGEHNV